MTTTDYYKKKQVADLMDEEITSREGCRNLAVFIMVMTLLVAIAITFIMIA